MDKLYAFMGDATHQDSPDGLNAYTVIANDAPEHVVKEVTEDNEDTIVFLDREIMDRIAFACDALVDTVSVPDGHILDLTEPYILCWDTEEATQDAF